MVSVLQKMQTEKRAKMCSASGTGLDQLKKQMLKMPNLRFAAPPWCAWSEGVTLTAAEAETSTLSGRGKS